MRFKSSKIGSITTKSMEGYQHLRTITINPVRKGKLVVSDLLIQDNLELNNDALLNIFELSGGIKG